MNRTEQTGWIELDGQTNERWQTVIDDNGWWTTTVMDGNGWRMAIATDNDGYGRWMTTDDDYDEWKQWWTVITITLNNDCISATKWSTFASSTAMACRKEEFIYFYLFSISCFFLLYILFLLLLELLQGQLTTWLQVQKHTRVHSLDANFKTHVQGKQMYVGLHHLV
jgi:hypothetical protein